VQDIVRFGNELYPTQYFLEAGNPDRDSSQRFEWLNSISSNQAKKQDISISLRNEAGNEVLVT